MSAPRHNQARLRAWHLVVAATAVGLLITLAILVMRSDGSTTSGAAPVPQDNSQQIEQNPPQAAPAEQNPPQPAPVEQPEPQPPDEFDPTLNPPAITSADGASAVLQRFTEGMTDRDDLLLSAVRLDCAYRPSNQYVRMATEQLYGTHRYDSANWPPTFAEALEWYCPPEPEAAPAAPAEEVPLVEDTTETSADFARTDLDNFLSGKSGPWERLMGVMELWCPEGQPWTYPSQGQNVYDVFAQRYVSVYAEGLPGFAVEGIPDSFQGAAEELC